MTGDGGSAGSSPENRNHLGETTKSCHKDQPQWQLHSAAPEAARLPWAQNAPTPCPWMEGHHQTAEEVLDAHARSIQRKGAFYKLRGNRDSARNVEKVSEMVVSNLKEIKKEQCPLKENRIGDLLGGPVVRTPRFHCRWHRFDSWSRNEDPACCALQQKKEENRTVF